VTRAVLIGVAIIVLGNGFSERLRLAQEKHILENLPLPEAAAYHDKLARRIRRVRIMRGLVLVALVVLVFSLKALVLGPQP